MLNDKPTFKRLQYIYISYQTFFSVLLRLPEDRLTWHSVEIKEAQ